MEIKIRTQDVVTIVSISGKIDSNTAPKAEGEIMPLITSDSRLILEMNECSYLSSAGLRILLMIAKTVSRVGGRAVLSGLLDEVHEVMEMTGFGDMFPNYPTTDAAIAAIKEEE